MAWSRQLNTVEGTTPWTPVLSCWSGSAHTTIPWPLEQSMSFWTYRRGIVNATAVWTDWSTTNNTSWSLNDGRQWYLTPPPVAPLMNGASFKIVGTLEHTGFPIGLGGWATVEYEGSLNRFKFLFKEGDKLAWNSITNANKEIVFTTFFGSAMSWGINVRYEANA